MDTGKYQNLCSRLCLQLRQNGKLGPADFFAGLSKRVSDDRPDETSKALEELIRSGKITDLAGFDENEEEAYDMLFAEGERLLQSLKT